MGAFLILSGLMIGVFCALDGMLFYVFFEATLIPMYLIIGIWGGPNKIYAAFKFFLYTLLGSLADADCPDLPCTSSRVAALTLATWHELPLCATAQNLVVLCVLCGLCSEGADVARPHLVARCARRGAHRWLCGAGRHHAEAGCLRLPALLACPSHRTRRASGRGFMIALSLVAVVYVGLVAMVQQDMKKLVAYSSVAHMGFVTLGFFIFNPTWVCPVAWCK
jgi:NADH-quinone oxidoreductase subunit M